MFQLKQASGCMYGKLIFISLCLFLAFNFTPISSKYINNLVYFGCFLPVFFWGVNNSARTLTILKSESTLWIFLLAMFISASLAGDFGEAKAALYILMLWVALVVMRIWNTRASYWLFSVLVVCSSFAMVGASYLWFEHYIVFGDYLRVKLWSDSNPNEVALMVVTAWVWFWEFYFQPKIKHSDCRSYFVGFAVLCCSIAWVVIVFQSRSALLGFLIYFGLKMCMDSRRGYLLASFFTAFGLFWMLDLHLVLMTRGVSHRSEIWIDAWKHLVDICGLVKGCGNDPYLIAGRFNHPHSAYLSMLYESGLVAFTFFLVFLSRSYFLGFKHKTRWLYLAAIGSGGVLATTGGVVHSPEPYWIYFWIPFLLIIIESRYDLYANGVGFPSLECRRTSA